MSFISTFFHKLLAPCPCPKPPNGEDEKLQKFVTDVSQRQEHDLREIIEGGYGIPIESLMDPEIERVKREGKL